MALEDFLVEFSDQIVDAIETVWEYAYDAKEAAEGRPRDLRDDDEHVLDENDPVVCALIDVEMALDAMRDMFSPRSHIPVGGRHASQVLIGRRAGTITIVRNSAPDLLEYKAARDQAAELLEPLEPETVPPTEHRPLMPIDDDLEPVFVELLEERYAKN